MLKKNNHVVDYVDDYLHEVLSDKDSDYVRQHCEECRICRTALDEARERMAAMQALPVSEVSPFLIEETLHKIKISKYRENRIKKTLFYGGISIAAAGLLLLVGIPLYSAFLEPSPYDLKVFGQNELFADSSGSLHVHVLNRNTGQGLKDIPVEISLSDKVSGEKFQLASFETDSWGTGQPKFRVPELNEGDYTLRIAATPGWSKEIITRTIKIKRAWKLMLTTDKPVYQPGQEILIRSLTLRALDLKPAAGQEAIFSISDPKGNVIFKNRQTTSRFGIASTQCSLADEILEGPYTVNCRTGQTESKVTVEVKKYVLPKFKITVDLDKPFYKPGDPVRGKISCNYFFGKPVSGGSMSVEIKTVDVQETIITRKKDILDDKGIGTFVLHLPDYLVGKKENNGDAKVQIEVKITDSAGQEQRQNLSRIVTTDPLRIEAIPEDTKLIKDMENTIFIFTSYADGSPARTRINVNGREYHSSNLGISAVTLTPNSETADLSIQAVDDQGLKAFRDITLSTSGNGLDFLFQTDKTVYRGGGTMNVLAQGGGNEPVFLDLIKDGQTILTQTIPMANGKGTLQFDIPPEVFGTIQLCAYRFSTEGFPMRKIRVIYVNPAHELKLNVDTNAREYRPGGLAKVNLTVTDRQSKPVPGAVSLAAVDEAVFSVLSQRPGMEQTFFNLDQEILKPIYAIYSWFPDRLTSSSPAEELVNERGLFSRTARNPNDRDAVLKKLVDENLITPRTLEVLERPDAEELIDTMYESKDLKALLQNTSLHTLTASSYPAKQQQIQNLNAKFRNIAEEAIWVALVLMAFVITLIILYSINRNIFISSLVIIVIILLLIGILVPTVNRARRCSTVISAVSNLHQLESAVQLARIANPDLLGPKSEKSFGMIPVKVREWFPETLFWRPELITDDQGRCSVDIPLADSITTWRLTASAVSAEGRLGGTQSAIKVFQPFFVDLNLPVSLTRGDEISVPVVVYNYLDRVQTVELKLSRAGWFELMDDPDQRIRLQPNEVKSTSYRLRVTGIGIHSFQITAQGEGIADAVKRQIEVISDGRRVEQVFNGVLNHSRQISLAVPENAIDGSIRTILRIYPSSFSQLVEGLDGIFQRPYGCFEQTSSTTYPNILALKYLQKAQKAVPEVETKARQYIHLGYQRLIGFEVDGGGFDWFGRPPANRILTAYGLMEFEDMARIYDIDPAIIERTRTWLLGQRHRDGSWSPEGHEMHDGPGQRGDLARLTATAYIAWAVFGGSQKGESSRTLEYLLSFSPDSLDDSYVLGLVCNALLSMEPNTTTARPYLDRLVSLKQTSQDGKKTWWTQYPNTQTAFYGYGRSGNIETTALAAMALLKAGSHPETVRGALSWLVEQKDSFGTWQTTQATILALKALIAGTGKPLGDGQERRLSLALKDFNQKIVLPADQAEVTRQIDLSNKVTQGENLLTLTDQGETESVYQVIFRYHVPDTGKKENQAPLSIRIAYDRSELAVNETVLAAATVVNRMSQSAPMVILDLPIPSGFTADPGSFENLKKFDVIAKYQITPRSIIVYLRQLDPETPLKLKYRLRATMPVKITVPPAVIYEYYNPDIRSTSPADRLTVRPPV